MRRKSKEREVNKLELDTQTARLLEQLKKQLRERTDDGVVRKAIALLAQVVEIAGDERYFTILTPQGQTMKINLD
jgi:hypothetical protein